MSSVITSGDSRCIALNIRQYGWCIWMCQKSSDKSEMKLHRRSEPNYVADRVHSLKMYRVPGQFMESLFCVKAAFTPNSMLQQECNVYFHWDPCGPAARVFTGLSGTRSGARVTFPVDANKPVMLIMWDHPAAPSLHNRAHLRRFWTHLNSYCTEFSSSWPEIPYMANKRGSMEPSGLMCYLICF